MTLRFGLPTLSRRSLMAAQIFLISVWPNSMASTTVSSFTSFAPDSIITMPSAVPTTMMLSRLSRISS